jgi:hypothetical protein
MRRLLDRPTSFIDAEWKPSQRPAYVLPLRTRPLPLIPRFIRAVERVVRR